MIQTEEFFDNEGDFAIAFLFDEDSYMVIAEAVLAVDETGSDWLISFFCDRRDDLAEETKKRLENVVVSHVRQINEGATIEETPLWFKPEWHQEWYLSLVTLLTG